MSEKNLNPAQASLLSRKGNALSKPSEEELREKTPIEEAIDSGEIEVSLEELFERDPLKLTVEDRRKLILAMREARDKWLTEEKNAENFEARANPNLGIKSPSQLTREVAQIKESGLSIDISELMGD